MENEKDILDRLNEEYDLDFEKDYNEDEDIRILYNHSHSLSITDKISQPLNNVLIKSYIGNYSVSKLKQFYTDTKKYYEETFHKDRNFDVPFSNSLTPVVIGKTVFNMSLLMELLKKLDINDITFIGTKRDYPVLCYFTYENIKLYICVVMMFESDKDGNEIKWTNESYNKRKRIKLNKRKGLI